MDVASGKPRKPWWIRLTLPTDGRRYAVRCVATDAMMVILAGGTAAGAWAYGSPPFAIASLVMAGVMVAAAGVHGAGLRWMDRNGGWR